MSSTLRSTIGGSSLGHLNLGLAGSGHTIFHQGFIEKTAKYTKAWTTRHLRLEDLEVSYAISDSAKVKSTIQLARVERFAEASGAVSDPRNLYGMVLHGSKDEKWVIRCHNESTFDDWYGKFRTVLAQHGLGPKLNYGLPAFDQRLSLPFAKVPLKDLANFLQLDDKVIYFFQHGTFEIPLHTKGPMKVAVIIGDVAVYICHHDGTVLRCLLYRKMMEGMFSLRKDGGCSVGIAMQRPEPDMVIKFEHSDTAKEFFRILGAVYKFVIESEIGDMDIEDDWLPTPELQVNQVTQHDIIENLDVTPPFGYQLVVVTPTPKVKLAEALDGMYVPDDDVEDLPVPRNRSPGSRQMTPTASTAQLDSMEPQAPGHPPLSSSATALARRRASHDSQGSNLNKTSPASATPNTNSPQTPQLQAGQGNHVVTMEVRDDTSGSPSGSLAGSLRGHSQIVLDGSANSSLVDDMHSLLNRLGLAQYEAALRKQGVDYDVLLVASPIDLLKFGVTDPHHRSAIMNAVLHTTAYRLAPLEHASANVVPLSSHDRSTQPPTPTPLPHDYRGQHPVSPDEGDDLLTPTNQQQRSRQPGKRTCDRFKDKMGAGSPVASRGSGTFTNRSSTGLSNNSDVGLLSPLTKQDTPGSGPTDAPLSDRGGSFVMMSNTSFAGPLPDAMPSFLQTSFAGRQSTAPYYDPSSGSYTGADEPEYGNLSTVSVDSL